MPPATTAASSSNIPTFKAGAFVCPHCNAFSAQNWLVKYDYEGTGLAKREDIYTSWCHRCHQEAVWFETKLMYPDIGTAPMPHNDLPTDCKDDFLEARSVISRSPRGAAALLRLVIQKLMPHLGEKGHKIDDDIASLVKKGLAVEVQQALDACRVIGNNAVHPGAIDLTDSPEMAVQMCELINFIVENRISHPKRIQSLYAKLPANNLAAIQARDSKKP